MAMAYGRLSWSNSGKSVQWFFRPSLRKNRELERLGDSVKTLSRFNEEGKVYGARKSAHIFVRLSRCSDVAFGAGSPFAVSVCIRNGLWPSRFQL